MEPFTTWLLAVPNMSETSNRGWERESVRKQECVLKRKVTVFWLFNLQVIFNHFCHILFILEWRGLLHHHNEYHKVDTTESHLQGCLPQIMCWAKLMDMDSGEWTVQIILYLCVQWNQICSLISTTLGICTPVKLSNMTYQDFFISESWLLNIYQHTATYRANPAYQHIL